MYHLIALYKDTYYYFGCTVNHTGAARLADWYIQIYPNLDNLFSRWHPYKEMVEFVKDFKTFEAFEKEYT